MARVRCPGCHKRQGSTTIDANGGRCVHCGCDVNKYKFMNESRYRLAIPMDDHERETLFNIARENDILPIELMEAALRSRIFSWTGNPELVKKDIMLAKLAKSNGKE